LEEQWKLQQEAQLSVRARKLIIWILLDILY
jgi:hypothetical protein